MVVFVTGFLDNKWLKGGNLGDSLAHDKTHIYTFKFILIILFLIYICSASSSICADVS